MARFWRYLFNRSNLFVILLIIITAINTHLSTRIKPITPSGGVQILRVESIKKDIYNGLDLIVSDKNGFWQVRNYTGTKVALGSEVVADIKYEQFSETDKFTSYYLGKGISGSITNFKLLETRKCDAQCGYINFIFNIKNSINNIFFQSACNTERWLTRFFGPNIDCLDVANLSKGLLVGDVSFSRGARAAFKNTGISHVVAVSGFQVVLISSFVDWALSKVRISRRKRVLLIVATILFFLTLVGLEPPILRSVLSIVISSFVLLIGRKVPQNKVLIYSGLILLWYNPFLILSISFQLSYLASFGLINSFSVSLPLSNKQHIKAVTETVGLLNSSENKLVSWSKNLSGYIIANLSIFLYTMPIIVLLNSYISVWSIVINIFLVPLVPVVSLMNIVALIPYIGSYINIFSLAFESLFLQFISNDFFSSSLTRITPFSSQEMVVYYLVLIISNTCIKYWIDYQEIVRRYPKKDLTI